jgi:hypothetical protein
MGSLKKRKKLKEWPSLFVVFLRFLRLEQNLQAELNNPRISNSPGDHAERRRVENQSRHIEIRMVEDVEKLGTKLCIDSLANLRVLEERNVPVLVPGAVQRILPEIAQEELWRDDKRRTVEIVGSWIDSAILNRSACIDASIGVAYKIGALIVAAAGAGSDTCIVPRRVDLERRSALIARNSVDLPASNDFVDPV